MGQEPKKVNTSVLTLRKVAVMFVFEDGVLRNGFSKEGRSSVMVALLSLLKSVDIPRIYMDSSFSINGFGPPRFFVEILTADVDQYGRTLPETFSEGEGLVISPHLGILLVAKRKVLKIIFAYKGNMPSWSDLCSPYERRHLVPKDEAVGVACRMPYAHPDPKIQASDGWKFLVHNVV